MLYFMYNVHHSTVLWLHNKERYVAAKCYSVHVEKYCSVFPLLWLPISNSTSIAKYCQVLVSISIAVFSRCFGCLLVGNQWPLLPSLTGNLNL